MTFAYIALWLLVVALGIQTGAGLFETRVLVPLWASAPPDSVIAYNAQPIRPDSGKRLWIILSPVTGLIAIANTIAAWQSVGPQRGYWLFAAIAAVAIIAVTFAYFVPVLLRLPRAAEVPPAQLRRTIRWWVGLNWIRFALLLSAWLSALKAFSYGG